MFGSKITQEQYDAVNQQLTAVNEHNVRLESALDEANGIIETLAAEKSVISKQLQTFNHTLEQTKDKHTQELDKVKKSIDLRVNQALANIGVSQFASEIYSDAPSKSDKELLAQFNRLPGEAKTEFYNKNKVALSRAVLSKN